MTVLRPIVDRLKVEGEAVPDHCDPTAAFEGGITQNERRSSPSEVSLLRAASGISSFFPRVVSAPVGVRVMRKLWVLISGGENQSFGG